MLLQAVIWCGASPPALRHFELRHWLVSPTPGMRKVSGTDDEWSRLAALTATTWGSGRATASGIRSGPGILRSSKEVDPGARPSTVEKPPAELSVLRWRNPASRRYFGARLVRDLFGCWQVMRVWGGIGSARGALRYQPLPEPAAFSAEPAQVDKRRLQRGRKGASLALNPGVRLRGAIERQLKIYSEPGQGPLSALLISCCL